MDDRWLRQLPVSSMVIMHRPPKRTKINARSLRNCKDLSQNSGAVRMAGSPIVTKELAISGKAIGTPLFCSFRLSLDPFRLSRASLRACLRL
jgi:hypothetical protein